MVSRAKAWLEAHPVQAVYSQERNHHHHHHHALNTEQGLMLKASAADPLLIMTVAFCALPPQACSVVSESVFCKAVSPRPPL